MSQGYFRSSHIYTRRILVLFQKKEESVSCNLLRINLHEAKRNYDKKGKAHFGMGLYRIN
jgi:hypothetical protein